MSLFTRRRTVADLDKDLAELRATVAQLGAQAIADRAALFVLTARMDALEHEVGWPPP